MGKMIINDMIFVAQIGSLTMSDCVSGDVCGTERPKLVSSGLGLLSCTLGQIRGGTGVLSDGNLGEPPEMFVYTALHGYPCLDHDASWIKIQ